MFLVNLERPGHDHLRAYTCSNCKKTSQFVSLSVRQPFGFLPKSNLDSFGGTHEIVKPSTPGAPVIDEKRGGTATVPITYDIDPPAGETCDELIAAIKGARHLVASP